MSRAGPGTGDTTSAELFRRRRLRRVLAEVHYSLRAPSESPARSGLSIWLGTAIGVLPVYGLHLALCIGLARLLRLSAAKAYLAAHINNPLTAPFLLYVSLATGSLLTTGTWPSIRMEAPRAAGVLKLGGNLILGALVVGILLGAILACVAFAIGRHRRRPSAALTLTERVAKRYLDAGILHWEFVRGKLRYDPLYFGLLGSGALAGRRRLLDLGCGRGILLALIAEADRLAKSSDWPQDWGAPIRNIALSGVERKPETAAVARMALGESADVSVADLAAFEPRDVDAVALLDVLHYLAPGDQERLLERTSRGLEEQGVLLIREAMAGEGLRSWLTRVAERLCALARMDWRQRFHYRTRAEWEALLTANGLRSESTSMALGTPYANVLITARKVTEGSPEQLIEPKGGALRLDDAIL